MNSTEIIHAPREMRNRGRSQVKLIEQTTLASFNVHLVDEHFLLH